jgi:hypothetical protein
LETEERERLAEYLDRQATLETLRWCWMFGY